MPSNRELSKREQPTNGQSSAEQNTVGQRNTGQAHAGLPASVQPLTELTRVGLTITAAAKAALDDFFAGRPRSAVRIYRAPGGPEGPRLALVLDEPNDEDRVFTQDGYTFCLHAALLEQAGGVTLDCVDDDFVLHPRIPFARPAGGCAGCHGGSCGSCG